VTSARSTATAAALAAEFASRAAEHDRDASFPFENFARLHEAGLLALAVPERLGGGGAGLARAAEVVGTIARGEPSTALVLAMQYVQHKTVVGSGGFPAHLADRLGREAVAGVSLVNALRAEPELGTPARGGLPAAVATRTAAGGWRLTGRKIYVTGAPILAWYLVWARTDEPVPRVGQFLVPAGGPGTRVEPTWDHLGLRASGSHDVLLEGVEVPEDHAVDLRRPEGWALDPATWAWNTLLIAALYGGVAHAARDWLVSFLKERAPSNLGAPLATLPRVQASLGEIEGHLASGARLVASAGGEVDAGRIVPVAELGLIKRAVTAHAIATVEVALTLTGNHGLSRRNPLERHHRDVLCGRIHTSQDDSVLLAAGKAALGLA